MNRRSAAKGAVPQLPLIPTGRARAESFSFSFEELCAAWTEGFQVQFVRGFRDGYAVGDRGRRPEPGDLALPDRAAVVAMVCHVLGLPVGVAQQGRYTRETLSKAYRAGEQEGRRIGYALGWKAIQQELAASERIVRLEEHGRKPTEADWRALGDGTAAGAARRMMLPAQLARSLGVTMALPKPDAENTPSLWYP